MRRTPAGCFGENEANSDEMGSVRSWRDGYGDGGEMGSEMLARWVLREGPEKGSARTRRDGLMQDGRCAVLL